MNMKFGRLLGVVLTSAAVFFVILQSLQSADTDGGWQDLFDGRTLSGWRASENAGTFKVIDGMIAASGPRSHLFYVGDGRPQVFKNFEFQADVKTAPGANSGIYFHTEFQGEGFPQKGMEIQINNSATEHNNYLELKKTGSLYGIRNVYKALAPDNEWFRLWFRVEGRRVQVRVNDILVVDYLEPVPPVVPKGRPGRRLSEGTFALQGHDPESKVWFKNLRVKRLPDATAAQEQVVVDDYYRQLIELGAANFPLVNFHVHLKGGLTLPEALAMSRQSGINYGIAINCGLNFSVTNDAGIDAYLKTMAGQPVFVGMQAEGREWVNLFSPEAVARFDYVFTDAMTIVDNTGRRMRLWIKDEVGEIKDKQLFMETLVQRTVDILENEPVDIFVNPTYLPDVLAAEYDALWTQERMQRVVDAAAKNGIAIEINGRLRLPKAAFLKMAKKAGCKFTFGTNNTDRDVGRLDYCLQMVKECGLNWRDMWMPKPDGQKPVQLRKGLRPANRSGN